MQSAELSRSAGPRRPAEPRLASSGSVVPLALAVSCVVIALDQVLHTRPAVLSAAPADQALHWLGDVVLALPLAAVALWAGDWLGSRLGISTAGASGVFARASLTALVLAALLVPAWFAHYGIDSSAQPQAPSALPQLSDHSSHSGHSHGGAPPPEVHWVSDAVLYALMSIPVAAGAACAGQRVASRLAFRLAGEADVVVRTAVSIGASALALTLGWFLHGVADQSGGLVTYTNALYALHSHAHFAHAHLASVTAVAVPPPFGYQLAHAAQDGLAGQAIGLPVIFAGLLWATRRARRGQSRASTSQLST